MTTFHDPQPQSRRAVRQNERAETTEDGFAPFPPSQGTTPPSFYSDPNAARDMWDTTARRAAQLPPAAPRNEAPVTGRRAAPAPTAAEPLTYSTQSRSDIPSYDGPTFRVQPTPVEPQLPPTQAVPNVEQPQFRVRDFSPEARAAQPVVPAPPAQPWSSDLEYHTEARMPAPQAPVYGAPTQAASAQAPVPEQTLTRREMRAMLQAEQDAAIAAQSAISAVTPAAYQAPVEYVAPAAYEAPAPSVGQPSALDALFSSAAPSVPQQSAPPQYVPQPSAPQVLPQVAPAPVASGVLTDAVAEFDALTRRERAALAPQAPRSQSSGHWAAQLEAEDDPFENTLSRSIGSGHSATNALVLPGMPKDTDIRGPLTVTGEVMLTGSIDLPRSLASTGATGAMEHNGIDALFDANDHEINSTDSSPVRAIRAVSTHHSGHGVTHTQKPKGAKALTVWLIAASSMAVVVAGLLVTAFAFNVF